MKARITGAVAIAALGLFIGSGLIDSLADDGTPPVAGEHPLVGSWSGEGFLYTFSADGTATGTDKDGYTYHGAWRPAGTTTATFILQTLFRRDGGQGLAGPLMLSADGDELITSGARFERMVPPDPAEYDFSIPEA